MVLKHPMAKSGRVVANGHWGELLQPRPCHPGPDQDEECNEDDAPGGLPQLGGGVGRGGQGVEGGGRPVGRACQRLGNSLRVLTVVPELIFRLNAYRSLYIKVSR